jgi:thiol:disulfide interchange protein
MTPCPHPAIHPAIQRGLPLTATLLAIAALVGCDVRDEPVQPAAADSIWPLVAQEATIRQTSPRGEHAPKPGIEYVEGYEAGRRRAETEQLPMLIVFRAAWCRWSCEFAQGALTDRGVVSLARRFVCVTADADRDAATCKAFGVSGFPTVVVLDAQGRERFRATGSSAAGGLATALRAVLDDPGATERIAGDIDEVQQR